MNTHVEHACMSACMRTCMITRSHGLYGCGLMLSWTAGVWLLAHLTCPTWSQCPRIPDSLSPGCHPWISETCAAFWLLALKGGKRWEARPSAARALASAGNGEGRRAQRSESSPQREMNGICIYVCIYIYIYMYREREIYTHIYIRAEIDRGCRRPGRMVTVGMHITCVWEKVSMMLVPVINLIQNPI